MEITLRSKRYDCNIVLHEKIIVIKGDGAAGKMLRTQYRNKNKLIAMLQNTEFDFLLEMAHLSPLFKK